MKPLSNPRHPLAGALSPLLVALAAALAGCGGSSDDGNSASSPTATTIGAAGGTVTAPAGAAGAAAARVDIPAGALATDTAIAVEEGSAGAPPLPGGVSAFGPTFKLTPHGTAFSTPATLTLPFAAGALPAGTRLALYKTTTGQLAWEPVAGASVSGSTISGPISNFSFAQAVAEPVPDQGAACDLSMRMSIRITGKVLDPRGRPHIGHVVVRDRAISLGTIMAGGSANEAGFFLVRSGGITSAGCLNRQYVLEVDSKASDGSKLYGELDVTALFPVGTTGEAPDVDITATPVILGAVQ